GIVVVDISSLEPGSEAELVIRLVNPDADSGSHVRLLTEHRLLTATDDSYSVSHGHALSVNAGHGALANDWSGSGARLSGQLVGDPAHGSVSWHADGSFTYTPDGGFVGTDSLTYGVTESRSGPTLRAATVTIHVTNGAPQAEDDQYEVRHDQPLTVAAGAG